MQHDLEDLRGLQAKGYASKRVISETRHSASMGLNRRLQIYTQLDAARTRKEEYQKQVGPARKPAEDQAARRAKGLHYQAG